MKTGVLISEAGAKSGDDFILLITHEICFICIRVEANVSCCLLQAMQQIFGLGRCIYEKL